MYALVLPEQGRNIALDHVPLQLEQREVQVGPGSRDASRELVVGQVQVLQADWEVPEGIWDAPSQLVPVQPHAVQVPEAGQGGRNGAAEAVVGQIKES